MGKWSSRRDGDWVRENTSDGHTMVDRGLKGGGCEGVGKGKRGRNA